MSKNNLNLQWFKGIDKTKKDDLEKLIRNSRIVLSRLKDILDADIKELNEFTTSDYDSPSWSHKQAHNNGKLDYARQVRSLLSFLETR